MLEAKVSLLPPEQRIIEEKFLEMLSLPKFRKALTISAGHTRKNGLETGFDVNVTQDSPFWIEKIEVGNTDRMEMAQVLREIDGPLDFDLPFKAFFHFHFHPGGKGLAIPSPSDLKAFKDDESIQPQYMGVGKVDEEGKVTVFVIKKPKYRLIGYDIQWYDENVGKVRTYRELQNLLRTISLSSFVLES